MNANKREFDIAFGSTFLKELMSMLYRRIYWNKADGKLSPVFYKSSLQGENLIYGGLNG